MQVMVLVKASDHSEGDPPLDPAMMAAMGAFNEELERAGVLVMARGLRATAAGRRVAFDGESRTVCEGPFTPAHDQLAGFWIWNVADMDEAESWVKRCPNPMPVPSTIEIRPFYELGRG